MLADGLKVLKHHRRSSKKPASRVIRYVPDYGGALVWDKPLRQPGAKASRVPLDAINQVELEVRQKHALFEAKTGISESSKRSRMYGAGAVALRQELTTLYSCLNGGLRKVAGCPLFDFLRSALQELY